MNNFFSKVAEPSCYLERVKVCSLIFSLLLSPFSVNAASLEIFQLSAFLKATELGPSSLQQDHQSGFTEIQDAGLSVSFNNQLNSDNLGSFSWEIKNNLGSDLTNVSFFGFLDIEIDEAINSAFNEFGSLVDVSGGGFADKQPDSWEIDEPGFAFGDIYANLLDGMLDNSNGVPAGQEDDVSLALGFVLGSLGAGETLRANFVISASDIGGLSHTDPDSNLTYYFNGSAEILPGTSIVPVPNSLALMALPLLLVLVKNFNSNKTS